MRQNTVENYFKDRQTDIQTYRQRELQTDRQTNRQTYRQKTGRQTESCKCAHSPATIFCDNMNFLQAVLERIELI